MLNNIADFLIFSEIPEAKLPTIQQLTRTRHFKKNHTLMFENDVSDYMYFIRSGMLKVYRMHEGQEIILGIITAGDMIGEIETLTGDDYLISSIEVIEDVTVWTMSKQDFLHLANTYPSIYKHAYHILAERLRVVNRLIRYLAFYDVRRKTANLLMDLYYNFSENESSDGLIKLHLNQTLLANMLGISRESMSTTLADLRDEGIIDMQGKYFKVLDEAKLETICDEAEEIASRRKWRLS